MLKQCPVCEEFLELEENFYKINDKRTGRSYYYSYCKECNKKKARLWDKEHPEQRRKIARKQNMKTKSMELRKGWSSTRRNDGTFAQWQKENPEKLKQYEEKRKIKKHEIDEEEWENCKKYFDYQCAYCGMTIEEHKNLYGQDFHKEHVDDDGSNKLDNCVPACKTCNSSKWKFSLEEWYNQDKTFYSENRKRKIIKWIMDDYKQFIKT